MWYRPGRITVPLFFLYSMSLSAVQIISPMSSAGSASPFESTKPSSTTMGEPLGSLASTASMKAPRAPSTFLDPKGDA